MAASEPFFAVNKAEPQAALSPSDLVGKRFVLERERTVRKNFVGKKGERVKG